MSPDGMVRDLPGPLSSLDAGGGWSGRAPSTTRRSPRWLVAGAAGLAARLIGGVTRRTANKSLAVVSARLKTGML